MVSLISGVGGWASTQERGYEPMRHEGGDLIGAMVIDKGAADEGLPDPVRRFSLHFAIIKLFLAECLAIATLGVVPLAVQEHRGGLDPALILERTEASTVALGVLAFLGCQVVLRAYQSKSLIRGGNGVWRGVAGVLLTFTLLITLAAAAKVTAGYSRVWFFSWMASSVVAIAMVRTLLIGRIQRALSRGGYVYRALAVGVMCSPLRQSEVRQLTGGFSRAIAPVRVEGLGDLAALEAVIRDERMDEVYISAPWDVVPEVLRHVRNLEHLAAHIYVLPDNAAVAGRLLGARLRDNSLHLHIQERPIDGWRSVQKRVFDILVSGVAFMATAPIMLVVAIAIKLESRGPVFFRQKRVGFNGRIFEVVKFRSMYQADTDHDAEKQTGRNDRRVTWVGRFIRRTSIDELPQIFNVLAGDMSIVGPRPHALKTTAGGMELNQAVSDYAARHRVRPGITGLAQVNGLRGELDSIDKLKERVRYDIEYIENWTLFLDIQILMRTFALVLHDPSAY